MYRVFEYGQAEMDYLVKKDKILGVAIDEIGEIRRKVTPDPFTALINSIVSQQISKKAAATVWERLRGTLTEITPQSIVGARVEDLRKCGMSERKAGYIRGVGEAVVCGEVDFDAFDTMDDHEIIKELTTLKGVGIWTAEMLLIFSLQRPDVVSWGDLAIRRGMMKLYDVDDLTREEFQMYRKRYSPFGSVASLYLWEISGQSE